jgi:hypothetical protein
MSPLRSIAIMAVALAAGATASRDAAAGITEGGPDRLDETRSLGQVIAQAQGRPVHIIYVHGMRAQGSGSSATFRSELCKYLPGGCRPDPATPATGSRSPRFDLGAYPKAATVVGRPIWATQAEWEGSRPFVDRYVFVRPGGAIIVVDEVNWWPLLFPLKCRFLLVPEAALSGADKDDLRLCSRNDDAYYAWIDPADAERLIAARPKSGGGALINAAVKQQIMNWGLSDAVMAAGPMQKYFHRAIEASFKYASTLDGKSLDDQEFVVISESLGSFVVLDALAKTDGTTQSVHDVFDRTFDLYFFANQFAMLELTRVDGIADERVGLDTAGAAAPLSVSPFRALGHWAGRQQLQPGPAVTGRAARVRQIIAFSDPSDMLTYDVPGIAGAKVVNLYDHNSLAWLGLVENPIKAHTGHSSNAAVLRTLLSR